MSTHKNPHAALAAALAEMQSPKADKVNPAFRSKYCSLDTILDAIRPVLAKHGLALSQALVSTEGRVGVRTSIVHAEGIIDLGEISIAVKPDSKAQDIGSLVTYLRRMTAQSAMGIATDTDDDGAAASAPSTPATSSRSWGKKEDVR